MRGGREVMMMMMMIERRGRDVPSSLISSQVERAMKQSTTQMQREPVGRKSTKLFRLDI